MARKETPRFIPEVTNYDGTTVIKLSGDIDMNHSPAVHQSLVEVLATRPGRLIIDLTNVSYMDSSGVGTLVDALRRMRSSGGKLALVAVAPRVLSVLQITKLDQFFEMYANLQEALTT